MWRVPNLPQRAVGVLRLQLIEVDRLRDELESTNIAGAALRSSSPLAVTIMSREIRATLFYLAKELQPRILALMTLPLRLSPRKRAAIEC